MSHETSPDDSQGVESLVERIDALAPSNGEERDALTLWPNRLHLARNAEDQVELFIEGPVESFGRGAFGNGLEHGKFQEVKDRRTFPALVVRGGPGKPWARPMAHLGYEALRTIRANPDVSNEDVLQAIGPYLALALRAEVLSVEHQLGLTGELIFLRQLLAEAKESGTSALGAVACWTGWDSATRDFCGPSVAVEVKTTGGDARHHWVHPPYQLLPAPGSGERVFVFSVGLRVDRSRAYKLTTAVERVVELLSGEAEQAFWERLGQYGGVGFDRSQWRRYELEPGFLATQSPTLYRVDHLQEILRPEAFVGSTLPARVLDLSYRVNLEGLPSIPVGEREALIRALLGLSH